MRNVRICATFTKFTQQPRRTRRKSMRSVTYGIIVRPGFCSVLGSKGEMLVLWERCGESSSLFTEIYLHCLKVSKLNSHHHPGSSTSGRFTLQHTELITVRCNRMSEATQDLLGIQSLASMTIAEL